MARYLFPGDTIFTDVNGDDVAEIGDGVTITFWSESVGGTNYSSDVKAADGVTAANLTTDANGNIGPVRGPDGVLLMWRDTGNSVRYAVLAVDEVEARMAEIQNLAASLASLQDQVNNIPGGGTGTITDLDDVPDGQSYVRMLPGERSKLTTVATGATNLTLAGAGTSTQAMRSDRTFTAAQVGAVQNLGGFTRILGWTGVGVPGAANGLVEGDWVAIPQP